MNVYDIMFAINEQYKEEELAVVKEDFKNNVEIMKDLKEFCDTFNLKEERIFHNPNRMPPFFYYDFPVFFEITEMKSESPFNQHMRKTIDKMNDLYQEHNWHLYLYMTKGCCSALIFNQLFKKVDNKEKYEVLTDFYVNQDDGHEFITKDMWIEALNNREANYQLTLPYQEDSYTIYRGAGSKSLELSQSLSWTLDSSVALKFAAKDSKHSIIYKAKVNAEDILDYFDSRHESEVIIWPENIKEVEIYEQKAPEHFTKELTEAKHIKEFIYYRSSFLDEELFIKPSKIHGVEHTNRVLLLTQALSYQLNLNARERAILANAALYHDIGRSNDGEDTKHGQDSVEIIEDNYITMHNVNCISPQLEEGNINDYELTYLDDEDEEVTKRIIHYHCIDDEIGHSDKALEGLGEEQIETYKKLYPIFKDADALDRVRINDISIDYLRHQESKELLTFASFLLIYARFQEN